MAAHVQIHNPLNSRVALLSQSRQVDFQFSIGSSPSIAILYCALERSGLIGEHNGLEYNNKKVQFRQYHSIIDYFLNSNCFSKHFKIKKCSIFNNYCIIFQFVTHYIGKGKKALFVQLLYDEIAQSSYFTIEAQLLIREPLEIKIIIKNNSNSNNAPN